MICRHCQKDKKSMRPRGLCWFCYHAPGVREMYGVLPVKTNRRGVGVDGSPTAHPPERTSAPPGSPRKLAVIAKRIAAGHSPYHPDDSPDWTEATHEDFAAFHARDYSGRSTSAETAAFHAELVGDNPQLDTAEPEHNPG